MNCFGKTVFFFLFFAIPLSGLSGEPGKVVAARLNGKVLLRDALPSHGGQADGKDALSASGPVSADVATLTAWILEVRKAEAMERLGIAVSDGEVQEAVRKAIGNAEDYVRRNNELLRRLPRALRRVRETPNRADEIYEEELRGVMSHALWLGHLKKNYTEEDIVALESHAPMDVGELDNVATAVRLFLEEQKLRTAVCGTGGVLAEREQCWETWCKRQVLEAPVVIEDMELQLEYERALGMRIADPAWPVRQEALKAIANLGKTAGIAERDQLAMSIAELIGSGTLGGGHRGGMHMALDALGELRSEKAIPCLVERLAFLPDPFLVEELLPTEMHYPAAGALVKIGPGTIDPVKSLLADSGAGDLEKRLGLWVLCETLGRERTEEWMKTRPSLLKLSTGESLVDLLPSVGQVFLPPGNRTDWPEPSLSRE